MIRQEFQVLITYEGRGVVSLTGKNTRLEKAFTSYNLALGLIIDESQVVMTNYIVKFKNGASSYLAKLLRTNISEIEILIKKDKGSITVSNSECSGVCAEE